MNLTRETARTYLDDNGLGFLFETRAKETVGDAGTLVDGRIGGLPCPPIPEDLAFLHQTIRQRKVFTVLEFGSGFSTLVCAHALKLNQKSYLGEIEKRRLRRNNPFEIHTVETTGAWLETSISRIPDDYRDRVVPALSDCHVTLVNHQLCSTHSRLPNITPDLIYLDGPGPFEVQGEINGLHFRHPDRTPISADLLMLEPLLLPGTLVISDGRGNNVHFLMNNFRRKWAHHYIESQDVHLLELRDAPIGKLNREQIRFCLGEDWFAKVNKTTW